MKDDDRDGERELEASEWRQFYVVIIPGSCAVTAGGQVKYSSSYFHIRTLLSLGTTCLLTA